ncbi:hypothetical protein AVEN_164624-1, partial [Araneus ventricosus]
MTQNVYQKPEEFRNGMLPLHLIICDESCNPDTELGGVSDTANKSTLLIPEFET